MYCVIARTESLWPSRAASQFYDDCQKLQCWSDHRLFLRRWASPGWTGIQDLSADRILQRVPSGVQA